MKWTRSQRIRTASQLDVSANLIEDGAPPLYQEVATKVGRLNSLGMSNRSIADALEIDDKTVKKSLRWLETDL